MWSSTRDLPFGGASVRSRFTDAVWQGPTWSFAILLFVLNLGRTSAGTRPLLVAGFAIVMLVSLVALLVRWERLPPWTQALLPAGDLLGAGLLVLAVPAAQAPTMVLLCSLPGVWLAFEFGRAGAAAAAACIGALGVAGYLLSPGSPSAPGSAEIVVPVLFVIGLVVVARLMSEVVDRVGDTFAAQTSELAEALELAEARLIVMNGVMESIDAGVTVLRLHAPPLHNRRAASLAERAGAAAPEAPGARVFRDDGYTPVPAADQAALRAAAGEEFAGLVQWIGRPGDQVAVVMSARQLTRPDGVRIGSVLASWDATDLMNAIRAREDFVATVSHELRTPLTAITASLELLSELLTEDASHADRLTLLSALARNASVLEARISELMASTTTVHHGFVTRPTDVTDLVGMSLAKHDAAIAEAGLALFSDLEDGVRARIDPTGFEQVVDNLVSNAVKYTATGGVMVSLRTEGAQVVLAVADSGVGMTPVERGRAFDRFYRAPRAKAASVQGLGIGLHLVKSIVGRHLGSVDLVSVPGMGTTVTVSIPDGDASDLPATTLRSGEAGGSPLTNASGSLQATEPEGSGAGSAPGDPAVGGAPRRAGVPSHAVERFTSVVAGLSAGDVGEFDLVGFLHDLTEDAAAIHAVDAAGLVLGEQRDSLRHMASSEESEELLALMRLQTVDGPSIECFQAREPLIDVDLAGAGSRWPEFAPAATAAGFARVHAFPLRLHSRSLGVLTLLARTGTTLDPQQVHEAQALADLAAVALMLERHTTRAETLEERVRGALHGRVMLEEARGLVARRTGASHDAAFEQLRTEARRSHRLLRDVAQDAIAGAGAGDTGVTAT